MKRSKMLDILYSYERNCKLRNIPICMNRFLKILEKNGMKPPTLPSDQCQELLKKYVDPDFNRWEEE